MASFDKEKHMQDIFKEFGNIERFHKNFQQQFTESLIHIISKYHQKGYEHGKIKTIINAYSGHLINVIESVIEKDKNYTEYRLMIELQRMRMVLDKITQPKSSIEFSNEVEKKVNFVAVRYFNNIVDFTANGFRLLDVNLKIFTRDFLTDFYFDFKKIKDYQI